MVPVEEADDEPAHGLKAWETAPLYPHYYDVEDSNDGNGDSCDLVDLIIERDWFMMVPSIEERSFEEAVNSCEVADQGQEEEGPVELCEASGLCKEEKCCVEMEQANESDSIGLAETA